MVNVAYIPFSMLIGIMIDYLKYARIIFYYNFILLVSQNYILLAEIYNNEAKIVRSCFMLLLLYS